ncbi:transporter substrate-binding domain-containing protein [Nguyenibacter sp. L1]|uniref:transporter substrate-binding domain-containing protein n=1 Tax=Nguyenibacter sp. L1 TaxID=3049350 RepID=UPI002B499445|nr:transporter substrate-binding domain-containing protein [Nguyenibacter sp. L1]WRH89011.1 transporter substrate-binding domain-containing protein [Nguyenibacter sp. L1]
MKAARPARARAWMAVPLLAAIAPCRVAPCCAAPCPAVPGLIVPNLIAPGRLTMATNPTLPPLQYMSVDGKLSGMRIVLGREIARRLCLEPAFLSTSFAQLTLGLLERRWDVIDTGMFYTRQRATLMEMVPYEIQAISVSVADDAPIAVRGVGDLAGRSIGVEMGGIEERHARDIDRTLRAAGKPGLDIKTFQNVGIAFAALRAHQVFAVFSIDAVAKRGVAQGGVRQDLRGLYPTPVALALRDAALADRVAAVLNAMKDDGTLARIMAPYGVSPLPGRIEASGPGRLSDRY